MFVITMGLWGGEGEKTLMSYKKNLFTSIEVRNWGFSIPLSMYSSVRFSNWQNRRNKSMDISQHISRIAAEAVWYAA